MKAPTLALIRFYQRAVSPSRAPACRFQPTCSHYGYEAIQRHGLLKGGALTLWRLIRCHPWNRGGYDPPP